MQILILLGSKSDLKVVESGLIILRDWKLAHALRIASAHRSPQLLATVVDEFTQQGGTVIICVTGKAAHLAGTVAARTVLPVIAVPLASTETAGLDALLSSVQMPGGVPVATMGFGSHGFANACLLAGQIIALQDDQLKDRVNAYRRHLHDETVAADGRHSVQFTPS